MSLMYFGLMTSHWTGKTEPDWKLLSVCSVLMVAEGESVVGGTCDVSGQTSSVFMSGFD